ncbi:MAG: hypothetical protein ACJ8CB_03075 [Ktedonobacteraceae bacterium]
MNTPPERTTQESSPFQWFAEQWAENPFPLFVHRRAGRYNSERKEALSSNCSPFAGILGGKNVAAPNRPTLMLDYFRRVQQASLIDPELGPIQLIFNIVGLCVFNRRLAPLKERLRDIMGEPAPDPAQVQEQIIRLVLHGALVSQSEGGEP